MRHLGCVVGLLTPVLAAAWNSVTTLHQFFSFQEFYTDAQYGPDFGYYSTGRILQQDGERKLLNGGTAKQDWFNSYTTLPMSLSPYLGAALCDRVVSMWVAMERPKPFAVVEFGGGTGMLARDFLNHCNQTHPDFYASMSRYFLGERSRALRAAQERTASEFLASGKFEVVEADARNASHFNLRQLLEKELGSSFVRGFVLSNELIDEFDPLRLRLVWRAGRPPSEERCRTCAAFRESHVVHFVDEVALGNLLRMGGRGAEVGAFRFEGHTAPCGLLDSPELRRLMSAVGELLDPEERRRCAPMQVCCSPFLLAVDVLMQAHIPAAHLGIPQMTGDLARKALAVYRETVIETNGTVLLTKDRYRDLRRLAAGFGPKVEMAFLTGGPLLSGRVHSREVFLGLSPARCSELGGWIERSAERLTAAARVRDATAPSYDRSITGPRSIEHLKLVVRPGEAEFVKQASGLLDEGFMVTFDYGADADALIWQHIAHPNHEGINTMDARDEFAGVCTEVSYLECPGLQDITTLVDFTELAEAGWALGGWRTLAYGPMFLLETPSFDGWLGRFLPHLIERGGGPRTRGLHSWYRKAEGELWATFKLLIQHRGTLGADWRLGVPELSWPLEASPQLRRAPKECWSIDISKPPLPSLVAGNATAGPREDDAAALAEAFLKVLPDRDLMGLSIEEVHNVQQQAVRDLHLALILADYWIVVAIDAGWDGCSLPDAETSKEWLAQTRSLAAYRRIPDMYGHEMFDRVLAGTSEAALGGRGAAHGQEPYKCEVATVFEEVAASRCDLAAR